MLNHVFGKVFGENVLAMGAGSGLSWESARRVVEASALLCPIFQDGNTDSTSRELGVPPDLPRL